MIKRIKDYFGKEEDYDEDEYEEEDTYEDDSYDEYERFNGADDEDKEESLSMIDESFSLSSVVSKKCEVLMVSPDTFNDALKIANDLKKNKIIILNLEDVEFEEGRKIVDFLSGTIYALGGSVNKISGKIILFTPIFVGVQNTISLRKKDKGMDVPNFRRS
ncbi:hypothetical protein AZF37_02430 [endosymbiont 'TC1' of Trimyema compressum]|uniref:cell division protein SepF n=1 Tax=endosymbiont 'TC1' of Trimyema compressum TaxID=243899 RepID=UPI0007F167D7|nr:cell division protein SepF [endosymbiont 'TC1' of Trimyema compressum]AMP20179.1 hypothetical protein AZF37_02430 [endosymbiont 'TC1' of Trimyema compressum]